MPQTQQTDRAGDEPQLLACTFVDQKFPDRAPAGARVHVLYPHSQLQLPAPEPALTAVRRWPRSLPQYEVGHLDRMAGLDQRLASLQGLTLLGNSYRGVGLPDLIHRARDAARAIVAA